MSRHEMTYRWSRLQRAPGRGFIHYSSGANEMDAADRVESPCSADPASAEACAAQQAAGQARVQLLRKQVMCPVCLVLGFGS